jgi:hypothetical protein
VFATSAIAQTSFYTDLLHRGTADYEHGQYANAVRELRLASFGLLEDIPSYETAQIYIALASAKTNQLNEARAAAVKLINAERVAPSYRTLPIDSSLRHDFEELLPKISTNEDLAAVPSMALVVVRGAKNWKDIADLYADIRTRRRLAYDEMATLFVAYVELGRIADAAGMRALLPAPVLSSPSIANQLTKVPAPPAITPPAMASPTNTAAQTDAANLMRDANKAISEARFGAARQIYLRLAQQLTAKRDVNLEIARGLHRVSALRESTAVYQKLYPLKGGEEVHMLAEAVNRFELGDITEARTLLSRAVTALPAGPELTLYRGLIERPH